jgi:hypothetical protein
MGEPVSVAWGNTVTSQLGLALQGDKHIHFMSVGLFAEAVPTHSKTSHQQMSGITCRFLSIQFVCVL